jgi:hypothetical protein
MTKPKNAPLFREANVARLPKDNLSARDKKAAAVKAVH